MSAWTAGEWVASVSPDDFSSREGGIVSDAADYPGWVSFSYSDGVTPTESDARLMAAAPNAVRALLLVRASTEWSCMDAETQEAVEAALAKAGAK